MGRPGSALDNAVIESWHSTLEFELRSLKHFATRAAARARVPAWIEDYNHHRRHSALRMMSPADYEKALRPGRRPDMLPLLARPVSAGARRRSGPSSSGCRHPPAGAPPGWPLRSGAYMATTRKRAKARSEGPRFEGNRGTRLGSWRCGSASGCWMSTWSSWLGGAARTRCWPWLTTSRCSSPW